MADLIKKWEYIDTVPKAPSTVFQKGWFISYDGLGGVIPAESASLYGDATPILGAILENIESSDDDFASARQVFYQVGLVYEFVVPVTIGTADATMVGSRFDVDGNNPGSIDVSAPGTQLEITAVLSETLVLAKISLVEPVAV